MARIRTIKPEFPHSESMGRVSRDARLLFVQLWTLCDDSGRARGSSRMLASLLFPYDDDAPKLIDTWMAELEHENCIVRYDVDGDSYLQVCKWLKHQKIDKPSASKIPPFDEASRKVAKPREPSSEDQGPRIKEGIKDSASQRQSPLDLKKALWSTSVAYLKTNGVNEAQARSFVGLLRKSHDDVAIVNAFAAAESAATPDPIPFIQAVLAGKVKHARATGQPGLSDHPLGIFGQLGDEIRGARRSAGDG